jgi:hypothetical protein
VVKSFLLAWLFLEILFSASAYAAAPTARVNRTTITIEDTLNLVIHVDDGNPATPNFSALNNNFRVLRTNQSSQHSFSNGRSASSTEWHITLLPRRTGNLLIPAIFVEGQKSNPIAIQVNPGQQYSGDIPNPIFFETSVNKSSVYVQEEVLFTVRIFFASSLPLDSLNLTEPEFDNTPVKKLAEATFKRKVSGFNYQVHERIYALYPQESGKLIIPEVVFTAREVPTRRSLLDPIRQTKNLRKASEKKTITVKQAPTSFSGTTWLPARSLSLTESWSKDTDKLQVGESITRTLTLRAEGLIGSQLPEITMQPISGAKLYPDQSQFENIETSTGMLSTRIESTAVIPGRAGEITFPEVNIFWWDTKSNTQKSALIPASTFNVMLALADTPPSIGSLPLTGQSTTQTASSPSLSDDNNNSAWMITSFIFLTLWLITLYLFWQLKRASLPLSDKTIATNGKAASEKQAYQILKQACERHETLESRQALLHWANAFWPELNSSSLWGIHSMDITTDMANHLSELDSKLYSNDNGEHWNGNPLLAEVTKLREGGKDKSRKENDLPPLYRS